MVPDRPYISPCAAYSPRFPELHSICMSASPLSSGLRVEAANLRLLRWLSHTQIFQRLQDYPHPRYRFLTTKTRLTMPKSIRSKPSEREIQIMAETFQTFQITPKDMALAPSQKSVPATRPPTTTRPIARSVREARDEKVRPSKASGGIPDPTATYLAISNNVPQLLPQPQHLLVVIDLNGTLLFRPSRKQPTKFVARPKTEPFLKYCVDTFSVVIWSSARHENVTNMCNAILTTELRKKVIAVWGREKFGLSRQDFDLRVQCYKRLTRLWSDEEIARSHPDFSQGARWDQTNTVLVDDSVEKGRSEPFNLIEVPEFYGNANEQGGILPQVHDYLNHLSMHSNVSACLRTSPFKAQLSQGTG